VPQILTRSVSNHSQLLVAYFAASNNSTFRVGKRWRGLSLDVAVLAYTPPKVFLVQVELWTHTHVQSWNVWTYTNRNDIKQLQQFSIDIIEPCELPLHQRSIHLLTHLQGHLRPQQEGTQSDPSLTRTYANKPFHKHHRFITASLFSVPCRRLCVSLRTKYEPQCCINTMS
jgi:hypothetical protein